MRLPSPNINFWLTVLFAFGIIVLQIGIVRGDSSIESFFELRESKALLEETVNDLRTQNSGLRDEILRLKNSPNYARKVLRDRYHLTEDDEEIVFFPD